MPPLTLEQIMSTHPLMVEEDDTVLRACELMQERRGGSVMVVKWRRDSAGGEPWPEVAGIFTERDVVKSLVRFREGLASMRVSEVMTSPVMSLAPEEDVANAENLMMLLRIRRIPVVREGRLVGLITRGEVMEAMRRRMAEDEEKREELEEKAAHDALTGLANRLLFDETLQREVARFLRHGGSLSLTMIDIDHFKDVNDRHGHPMGDKVLKQLAAILSSNVRKTDLVARWGGEEFAVLETLTEDYRAGVVAEKLRQEVEKADFGDEDVRLKVTISAGVAVFRAGMQRASQLVKRADEALYRAKRSGRNRVVLTGD